MRQLQGRNFLANTEEPSRTWLQDYVYPEDQPRVIAVLNEAILTKGIFELAHRVWRLDGGIGWMFSRAVPLLGEDGEIVEWFGAASDITGRKQTEEQLHAKATELEDAYQELQQFAYAASHDLREPLRMMASFSQSLEKRYRDRLDKTANEYIGFIVGGAARMQNLLDDLLAYSRVGTRKRPFETVNLEDVLHDVLANLKIAIEESNARLESDPLPVIQADRSHMMQVLQNLVGNAIKFRRPGEAPVIRIRARREGAEWVFSVKDDGIGIDPELFGRLFKLFSRLHTQDQYPGTGVGLAVAKRIVDRHRGRIWVESEPGKGATFSFSIPVRLERGEHDTR